MSEEEVTYTPEELLVAVRLAAETARRETADEYWAKAIENAKRVRRETAEAVLDRVREYLGMADDDGFRDIAREFRVES